MNSDGWNRLRARVTDGKPLMYCRVWWHCLTRTLIERKPHRLVTYIWQQSPGVWDISYFCDCDPRHADIMKLL